MHEAGDMHVALGRDEISSGDENRGCSVKCMYGAHQENVKEHTIRLKVEEKAEISRTKICFSFQTLQSS